MEVAEGWLVAALGGQEPRFAFVAAPYCYKELAPSTITGSLCAPAITAPSR